MDVNEFLARNRIDSSIWESAEIQWETLIEIADDYKDQQDQLQDTAELFARVVQRFTGVHSVRWRIKDKEHLMEKIIRKRAEKSEKYRAIDKSNYFEKISDLVGIRALHLFKDECFSIDSDLRNTCSPIETPIAYVREGDPKDLRDKFLEYGFDIKEHPAGYRSVHYVCKTEPLQRKVLVEIQVRTIFEEGWSEIDHRVRYPNFSNDKQVARFLTIFNRIAGSADEMGTFIQDLTKELKEKEDTLSSMVRTIGELKNMKQQDDDTNRKLIDQLEQEVAKQRKISLFGSLTTTIDPNAIKAAAAALASISSL